MAFFIIHNPCTWTEEEWISYLRTSQWITYDNVLGVRKRGSLTLMDMPKYMVSRDVCNLLLRVDQIMFFKQIAKCKKLTKGMVKDYINAHPGLLVDIPKKCRTWEVCLIAYRKWYRGYTRRWLFFGYVPNEFKVCCSVKTCGNRHSFNLVTFPCGEKQFVCEKETGTLDKRYLQHHNEMCGLSQAKKMHVLNSQSTLPMDLVNIVSQLEGCPFSK